jgi:hypothetical protein
VITHAGEVYTTDAREPDISGTRSDFRLNGYQNGCAFKFFADRVRRLRAIEPPSFVGDANLRLSRDR